MQPLSAACQSCCWVLNEFGDGHQQHRAHKLSHRELLVGRVPEADLCIPANAISKRHAQISFEGEQMIVQDLGSTNGTFVNGQPISCCVVADGDLLQFANTLFQVARVRNSQVDGTVEEGILPWAQTLLLFDRLISDRAVIPHFQPIVTMDRLTTPAYELLARSAIEGLTNPATMFGAAERLGQQTILSELMREEGLRAASGSQQLQAEFYLNTHPCEVVTERLMESLQKLRQRFCDMRITIEIHEAAVTQPKSIAKLRDLLNDLNMHLAYDDFGAGQGRLPELGEVPPDVLKFDMQLIRAIDAASAKRQEMIATLVRMALDLGSRPLAEGVETEAEHDTCRQMGFELGQGFLYGRPQPFAQSNGT